MPGLGKRGKPKAISQVFHFPPGPCDDDHELLIPKLNPKKGSRPLRGPPHAFVALSLRSSANPISCTSFDWKMLPLNGASRASRDGCHSHA
jgi:hypothetical protein